MYLDKVSCPPDFAYTYLYVHVACNVVSNNYIIDWCGKNYSSNRCYSNFNLWILVGWNGMTENNKINAVKV